MCFLKIEVWSDFVCPFCYIGKRTLEKALDKFEHKDQVNVTFKSYELDPGAESDESVSFLEKLAKNKSMSVEQVKQMNESIVQRAREVGLDYNFDNIKQTNTANAHRLMKYAETQGKADAYTERVLKAHFVESQFIGSRDTLVRLAAEVGLDEEEARDVLESEKFLTEVRVDEAETAQLGIQGVPFFVINRKYAISGAQPEEVFTNALSQIWEEEHQTTPLQTFDSATDGVACTDGNCDIPDSK